MDILLQWTACLLLPLLFLANGCSQGTPPASRDEKLLKQVELVVFLVGEEPRDMPLIGEELNKRTMRDLNCTVNFHYTTWSDYMQRYNLLLSSGQPIDLIFTSDWLRFSQYAERGAFLELDGLLPLSAPDLFHFIPEDYWDAVRIDGKIYTIPSIWPEYTNEGILYRKDLQKKYGLPEPDSLEKMEQYFDGILQKEPQRIMTSEIVVDNGYGPCFSATSVLNLKYRCVDLNMPYGLMADYDTPSALFDYWDSEDFIEDMQMFKRWADKGYWTKSALTNNNSTSYAFINQYVVANLNGVNPVKYARALSLITSRDPEAQVGYSPYGRAMRLVKPVHPLHNGIALPLSARSPERALMFYEKLLLDKEYNHLTQYGLEGIHYRVDEEGYYTMIGTMDTNGFTREAMNGWAWRNPDDMLFDRNFDVVLDLFQEFESYSHPDIFFSFVEDYTPYQAERAALHQVQSQYLVPIQAGFVEDVEGAVKKFREQAEMAGLDKIQEEYSRQWKAYCREHGL